MIRVGHGFDAHRFCDNKPLFLGGVKIPFDKGLLAHSDGDVLLHAICDALLGAAGLPDIGNLFPDSDDRFENIDSCILLVKTYELIKEKSLFISNIDVTVIAQAPKLSKYILQMREVVSQKLSIDLENINIKATTTEGLGYIGREEGIAVHAVVLLSK